jgi:hypothetical protein
MHNIVYTAMSRHSAFAKELVCAHVFHLGSVPLNPFMMFGYFLYDMVDRDQVRSANAMVISAVNEVWSYGPIANGCLQEILQAQREGKVVRYFNVASRIEDIREIEIDELVFESLELRDAFLASR